MGEHSQVPAVGAMPPRVTPVAEIPRPMPPVGFDVRHLVVTTGDIDRLLSWYERFDSSGDDFERDPADERLARYLRDRLIR